MILWKVKNCAASQHPLESCIKEAGLGSSLRISYSVLPSGLEPTICPSRSATNIGTPLQVRLIIVADCIPDEISTCSFVEHNTLRKEFLSIEMTRVFSTPR